MRIPRSQSCAQKIAFVREKKQRMIANPVEVAVEGGRFLISVDGIFGGIDIDDEPPFVSAPKKSIGGSADGIFEGL
jgi:hypothetical protein